MADIDVQRKSGMGWLWWILGLIVLALIIWWIVEANDNDADDVAAVPVATAPAAEVATPATAPMAATAPTTTAASSATIADVLANPTTYAGQPFSTGQVKVAEVVSDRGFWVEGNNGQRLFVVMDESPKPGTADVQGPPDTKPTRTEKAGDMVQINGTLYTSADQVQPPLDAQTKQAVQGQPIFLQANVADIQNQGS